LSHTAVTAVTVGGRYLRLDHGQDELRLRADGDVIDATAVFERIELPHDRIALRTLEGRYLAVRPDQGLNFGVYPEDELSPRAVFEEILWPDGEVALRSCELTFVSAQQEEGCPVVVNRVEAGPQERFRYAGVPASLVPAPRRSSSSPDGPRIPRQAAASELESRPQLPA
jgi:hypothetical protein